MHPQKARNQVSTCLPAFCHLILYCKVAGVITAKMKRRRLMTQQSDYCPSRWQRLDLKYARDRVSSKRRQPGGPESYNSRTISSLTTKLPKTCQPTLYSVITYRQTIATSRETRCARRSPSLGPHIIKTAFHTPSIPTRALHKLPLKIFRSRCLKTTLPSSWSNVLRNILPVSLV
jgi:hypothetical protein